MKSSCSSHMLAAIAFAGTLQITQAADPLNARLTDPIDQGHCRMLLAQLGDIARHSGRSLKINPANGHILDDPEAAKLWTRDYQPNWEPTD